MAGHRCDHQHFWVLAFRIAFEVKQFAEGLFQHDFFANVDAFSLDRCFAQAKFGFAIAVSHAQDHVGTGVHHARHRIVA